MAEGAELMYGRLSIAELLVARPLLPWPCQKHHSTSLNSVFFALLDELWINVMIVRNDCCPRTYHPDCCQRIDVAHWRRRRSTYWGW